jgi:ArsR family transcriptional regulator, virulence genes transcriptional regulator
MARQPKLNSGTIYEMQAQLCGALANPVRLQILELISSGEMTSSDLLEALKIPKTNMSQHLSVLKDAGIIRTRKEGLYQYMSLALPKIKDACAIVKSVLLEKIEQDEKRHSDLRKELKAQR